MNFIRTLVFANAWAASLVLILSELLTARGAWDIMAGGRNFRDAVIRDCGEPGECVCGEALSLRVWMIVEILSDRFDIKNLDKGY
ncbi:hypothetical protein L211DRAFT_839160 [Terfezia boudieri ATCC MYA-4762]|uniref:Uncharacterized protein n=1 Tax=Terfezia boudieri ATCC MYA-4762 TaxID=1051890 RepID=A0A3N4LJ27_9PEZI|nr:hypothetical protein L211DRAFT_839160 [Terfezia boudieri ATCC MYA-4762]